MQKSDLDLASTRTLLDELFKCVPNLDSNKKYIYPNASIVKNKDFENGIVKVIDSIWSWKLWPRNWFCEQYSETPEN